MLLTESDMILILLKI